MGASDRLVRPTSNLRDLDLGLGARALHGGTTGCRDRWGCAPRGHLTPDYLLLLRRLVYKKNLKGLI